MDARDANLGLDPDQVRRAGAKLLLHYGSVARFVDGSGGGGGGADCALRADREERTIRLIEGYMHAKGR